MNDDGKWVIRKCTCSDYYKAVDPDGPKWHVYDPDGMHSGDFASWQMAIEWATDPMWRIEHFLATQGRES